MQTSSVQDASNYNGDFLYRKCFFSGNLEPYNNSRLSKTRLSKNIIFMLF